MDGRDNVKDNDGGGNNTVNTDDEPDLIILDSSSPSATATSPSNGPTPRPIRPKLEPVANADGNDNGPLEDRNKSREDDFSDSPPSPKVTQISGSDGLGNNCEVYTKVIDNACFVLQQETGRGGCAGGERFIFGPYGSEPEYTPASMGGTVRSPTKLHCNGSGYKIKDDYKVMPWILARAPYKCSFPETSRIVLMDSRKFLQRLQERSALTIAFARRQWQMSYAGAQYRTDDVLVHWLWITEPSKSMQNKLAKWGSPLQRPGQVKKESAAAALDISMHTADPIDTPPIMVALRLSMEQAMELDDALATMDGARAEGFQQPPPPQPPSPAAPAALPQPPDAGARLLPRPDAGALLRTPGPRSRAPASTPSRTAARAVRPVKRPGPQPTPTKRSKKDGKDDADAPPTATSIVFRIDAASPKSSDFRQRVTFNFNGRLRYPTNNVVWTIRSDATNLLVHVEGAAQGLVEPGGSGVVAFTLDIEHFDQGAIDSLSYASIKNDRIGRFFIHAFEVGPQQCSPTQLQSDVAIHQLLLNAKGADIAGYQVDIYIKALDSSGSHLNRELTMPEACEVIRRTVERHLDARASEAEELAEMERQEQQLRRPEVTTTTTPKSAAAPKSRPSSTPTAAAFETSAVTFEELDEDDDREFPDPTLEAEEEELGEEMPTAPQDVLSYQLYTELKDAQQIDLALAELDSGRLELERVMSHEVSKTAFRNHRNILNILNRRHKNKNKDWTKEEKEEVEQKRMRKETMNKEWKAKTAEADKAAARVRIAKQAIKLIEDKLRSIRRMAYRANEPLLNDDEHSATTFHEPTTTTTTTTMAEGGSPSEDAIDDGGPNNA